MKPVQNSVYAVSSKVLSVICACFCLVTTNALTAIDYPGHPQVGIDSTGNAVSVWDVERTSDTIVQGAVFTEGSGWAAATTISTTGEACRRPLLAVNDAGDAITVWLMVEIEEGVEALWTAKKPFNSSWGSPERLSIEDSAATNYTVKMNADGDSVATWESTDGTTGEVTIYSATSTLAGSWTVVQISD